MRKFALILVLFISAGLGILSAQTVSGLVTGSEDGLPIPGATVLVKGTTTGVITDLDGKYTIKIPTNGSVLQFSFVGMVTKEVTIGTQTTINMVLNPDVMDIEGVIVTAMGVSREKKALGYSTQGVDSKDISRAGSSNLSTALQGKVSGVEIKPSSGMPGASTQIVIRGARSFTGNNTPLYVVDGMPIVSTADFSTMGGTSGADIANRAVDIDPNDIESINILKGQAASAIYGIRASNGVIIITTKSGRGKAVGKPNISFSNFTSFENVSRTPEYQTTYASGSNGSFRSINSNSWGPKIVDLPDDPNFGGNNNGHPGMYYVLQLEQGGLDPWVKPQVYDNFNDYFKTGYTTTTSLNINQATEKGSIAFGLGNTTQEGIAPSTGMKRWNAKSTGESKLNDRWTLGYSSNFSRTHIDKLPSANDAALQGIYAAPPQYNLKGNPSHRLLQPFKQINFRAVNFDNPYWAAENNQFTDNTDRFFGNGYLEYVPAMIEKMTLKSRFQVGMDSYSTHYQDIFEFGHADGEGAINNYGITSTTINSLATLNFNWTITNDLKLGVLLGNEFNHRYRKLYSESGLGFNFGAWPNIQNAKVISADEEKDQERTVGFFGNISLDYKGMLYLNATGRNDFVSTMPRNNNSFFYPSVALGFVLSELESVNNLEYLSFAKIRASYAEVGQAGVYLADYFATPNYDGGMWYGAPIQFPINGISGFLHSNLIYDPDLVPQNTESYELGTELRFLNNRIGVDYAYSYQKVTNQIFDVPLAGSTGANDRRMNGGSIHTNSHEFMFNITPIQTQKVNWDININYSKINNFVDQLAPGVESIYLGGFTTPQVRASIGTTFPVIYGTTFMRDANGNVLINDDAESDSYGMPMEGAPGVIGEVSPDFLLGFSNRVSVNKLTFTATMEWKQGGQMYHGTNGLLDSYGVSKRTEDREKSFIYPGVKSDGTPNDIVRGGSNDPDAYQYLNQSILSNIDEFYIKDNSFVKLREVTLSYRLPKSLLKSIELDLSIYARNLLLWTELPNFDPEASQGNNNMGGAFERFSMPQTSSYGFGINLNF